MITKEITSHDLQEIKIANLKCHITSVIDSTDVVGANGDTSEWTSFGTSANPFVKVEEESYGEVFKLSSDKSSIIVTTPCIYEVAGCVHFINNENAASDITIGIRMYKNGKSEARCSQTFWSGTIKSTNGEETLRYSGTDVTHKPNEYFNIQYYYDDDGSSNVDFTSSSEFDNQVAVTLYVKAIGLPQYTKRNEKIEWHITN